MGGEKVGRRARVGKISEQALKGKNKSKRNVGLKQKREMIMKEGGKKKEK